VNASSTLFMPMVLTGYQKSYGGIYTATSDVYEANYATGFESYFPGKVSYTDLVATGKVPLAALFDTASLPGAPTGQALTPLWQAGFGTPNLIKTSYRNSYLGDAQANNVNPLHPLRAALKQNDLTVTVPQPVGATMLCGGGADPIVYYSTNTGALLAKVGWTAGVGAGAVLQVNMDLNNGGVTSGTDPFGALKTSFTSTNPTSAANYASTYHTNLVPYCVRAARGFFDLVN
jgi:hypothetical protein